MAANPLPDGFNQLIALAEDAADGAAAHEGAIGLLQNTEARIRADITALSAAQQAFQSARQAKRGLVAAQRTADSNGRAFIASFKNVMQPVLGSQWTTDWVPTGFVNNSLETPSSMPARQTLLAAIRDYLTANPAHENAPLNVTAAQAAALHTALSDARSAVNGVLTTIGNRRKERNAARVALEKRLSGLIGELDQLLEGDDPLWLAFGLNMPDADQTPDQPNTPVLSLGPENSVFADWDDVPNASYYRLFKQVVGVDANFVEVNPNPQDSFALVGTFAAGQTVNVKVRAVVGTLQGPDSEAASITLPESELPAPTGLQLSAGPMNSINALWNAVTGANHYVVEHQRVGTDPSFTQVDTTTGTSLSFGGYSGGTTVRVRVKAVGTPGPGGTPESPYSAVAEITFP